MSIVPQGSLPDRCESLAVQAVDHTLLHVQRHGAGSEPFVCVFIHGSGDAGHVWDDACSVLARRYPLLVPDLRGHGESGSSPNSDYALSVHVADVQHIIATLRLRRILVIGHSLGALIAVHIASQCPAAKVVGVVLVDTCTQPDPEGMKRATAMLRASMRVYCSVQEYEGQLLESRPILSPAVARQLARRALRACDGGFELKLDPAIGARSSDVDMQELAAIDAALPRISCPALLIRGVGSAIVSAAAAQHVTRRLRYGRLATIQSAGHAVMSDNPQEFKQALVSFIESAAVHTYAGRVARNEAAGAGR